VKINGARKTPARAVGVDEILPEYDFSRARPKKYASRYAKNSIVITLDPDVAAVFPELGRRTKLFECTATLSGSIGHDEQRRAQGGF
jgi:hypothetical protein